MCIRLGDISATLASSITILWIFRSFWLFLNVQNVSVEDVHTTPFKFCNPSFWRYKLPYIEYSSALISVGNSSFKKGYSISFIVNKLCHLITLEDRN